jgi:hypothetical protein
MVVMIILSNGSLQDISYIQFVQSESYPANIHSAEYQKVMYEKPHGGKYLAARDDARVVEGREEGVDVDSFVEADVAESNPILGQSVGRDHDELALDVFIYSHQLGIPSKYKTKLTISEHPSSNMASTFDNPRALESRFCGYPDEASG